MFLLRIFHPNPTPARDHTYSCRSPADAAWRIQRAALRWGIAALAVEWDVVT